MHSKLVSISALLILSLVSQAVPQSDEAGASFTLQVASFPDSASAEGFITKLKCDGENPIWGTIELPGRGNWTRVFIGSFQSAESARRYGERLVKRGIISEFLVRTSRETQSLSRPRVIDGNKQRAMRYSTRPIISSTLLSIAGRTTFERKDAPIAPSSSQSLRHPLVPGRSARSAPLKCDLMMNGFISTDVRLLPEAKKMTLNLLPPLDATLIPRPDPVQLAFRLIVGETRTDQSSRRQAGGLWLSGDVAEAMARLRWILGQEGASLLSVDAKGRVLLDRQSLARLAGVSETGSPEAPLMVINYIYSNEGLLLLVQLTQGVHRYCLHIGRQAPTLGRAVEVNGSMNLDNNYDSRINPYRRFNKKLDIERPPAGFDAMVAINPIAQWFNLREHALVPVGNITFHELAEAHAKLDLELDYLGQGTRPGAHNVALDRERRLKSQRPLSNIIITAGSNRVLRSEEEIRQFYSQAGISISSQR